MGRVITTVSQIEQDARIHEARGAERERRRIRRAQLEALDMLIIRRNALLANDIATADTIDRAVALLDAATRAPRKKGRK